MDKYEYKVRSEEIKTLIAKKEYLEAAKIADTIDWRRVKSIVMLCTISDLYKINRRFEESREILLMAYEKHPEGRMIVYSLCELSIKLDDIVQAAEYYKKFVQIAPRDNSRYILLYKLYEAQDVSIEERIAVLEEFKKREHREKWAYELAYLYHRIGLSTKCVEECDDLILWFGEGRYVNKAMELKMLHCPLTEDQKQKYTGDKLHTQIQPSDEDDDMDIQVKTVNVGQYDTINLQKALAESMKEVMAEEPENASDKIRQFPGEMMEESETEVSAEQEPESDELYAEPEEPVDMEELNDQDGPGDYTQRILTNLIAGNTDELTEIKLPEEKTEEQEEEPSEKEVFFEDTDTIELPADVEEPVQEAFEQPKEKKSIIVKDDSYAELLSQEYDGQISLVVPETEKVEKQITGQLSIEDVLLEWEKMKKENEQKRAEDVRKRVLEQTGAMFSDFDASTKQGILGELDAMAKEAMENERRGRKEKPEEIAKENPEEIQEEIQPEQPEVTDEYPEVEELEEIKEKEAEAAEDEIKEEPAKASKEDSQEEKQAEKEVKEEKAEEKLSGPLRALTHEEKQLFGPFIQTKSTKDQLIEALDKISLASYTGNLILTGDEGLGTLELARNIIKEVQMSDDNFAGKLARIGGAALNKKDMKKTIENLEGGALIVGKAGHLAKETVEKLIKELEQEKQGIIVILEDTKYNMNKLLEANPSLNQNFNVRIDIEALDNDGLVGFAKKYALDREYVIDELGILALYSRIAEMQTSEHVVTIAEVKGIVEKAMKHASKKNVGHFMDVLLSKRYDEEDMIILREKDFVNH